MISIAGFCLAYLMCSTLCQGLSYVYIFIRIPACQLIACVRFQAVTAEHCGRLCGLGILAAMAAARRSVQQKSLAQNHQCMAPVSDSALKEAYKTAILRWHPDRFLARFALAATDRQAVADSVSQLAQQVNKEWSLML